METIDIQIKSNAPEVITETKSLREQVRELRKDMESCEVGSDEYNAALARLAQTTHDLREQQEAVKNSAGDLGTVLNNLQGVGTGIAAGFSSINAVMTLTGSNTENLQKTMVQLQAGIALVQGMQGLEGLGKKFNNLITSVKSFIVTTKAQTEANKALAASNTATGVTTNFVSTAFKGLKQALISSGIGGIVVLVGTLITAMTALVGIIRKNLQVQNEYKDANEQLNKAFDAQNEHLNNEIKLMTASGASQQEIIKEKQRLIAAQKAETEATLKNARARLQSLKSDSAWTRFWHGENKVIKELEQETIPALEATLDGLEKQAESLAYDYKAEEIKTQKELEAKRKQAAQKAIDDAKKVAEAQKKAAEDAGKKATAEMDKIVESYKEMIQNIQAVQKTLSLNPLQSAQSVQRDISDVEAWIQIYGTNPTRISSQLSGVMSALVANVNKELVEARDKSIKEADGDQQKIDEILKAYANKVNEVRDLVDNFTMSMSPNVISAAVVTATTEATDAAGKISDEFTEQFNALNTLYKEGIISYEEYYDTLLNVKNDYNTAVEQYDAKYIADLEARRTAELEDISELYDEDIIALEDYRSQEEEINSRYDARISELQYQYAIKPLAFQKEVGEKFLNELKSQLAGIENEINKREVVLQASITRWDGWMTSAAGMWNNTLYQRYQKEKEFLEAEKALEKEKYSREKAKLIEEMNNNMLTVEQRAELWAQIEQLYADHLIAKEEFTARSRELDQEWKDNLTNTIVDGVQAFASLTTALNSVSQAELKEYKRQLEAGEISQEQYNKLEEESLKKQAALQIATTVMQTGAGIASAWATAMQLGPIAGPIMAGIETAALIANMVAQIISIKTALKEGLAGQTSGGGSTQTPDTSFTLQSPDAYQTTLSDETQSDLQANAHQNQRVYVVSSDISDAQQNEKTTVTTATF